MKDIIYSFINKIIIILCVFSIVSTSTLTIHAYEYEERETNDTEVNDNTPLSEEEIDEIIEEFQEPSDEEDIQIDTDEITQDDEELIETSEELIIEESTIKQEPLLFSLLAEDPDNIIDITYEDGLYLFGRIEATYDDYVFDYLELILVNDESIIESINSLEEDDSFKSSIINFLDYETSYQVKLKTYYKKELFDELGEPIIDEETSSQKVDVISFDYYSDSFILTKLLKDYIPYKLSNRYGIDIKTLVEDNHILSNNLNKDEVYLIRNPIQDYEPISLSNSDIDILSKIGIIDSNTYINDINIASGNYIYSNNDLYIDEYKGIYLNRYYNSYNNLTDNYFSNFSSSLDTKLIKLDDYYCLILKDGRVIRLTGSNNIYNSSDNKYTLVLESNTYKVTYNEDDKDSYTFNEYFELIEVSNKYGLIFSLVYDNHKLNKLLTKANKEFTFELNNHNQISKINLLNDAFISYVYENDLLTSVIDELGYKTSYIYIQG